MIIILETLNIIIYSIYEVICRGISWTVSGVIVFIAIYPIVVFIKKYMINCKTIKRLKYNSDKRMADFYYIGQRKEVEHR